MNGSRDDMIVLLVGGMDVSVLTKVIKHQVHHPGSTTSSYRELTVNHNRGRT